MPTPLIRKSETKCFADYCARRYRTLKELAGAYGVKESTLSRHIARHKWVSRRAELEAQVVAKPAEALQAIECEVVKGDRPPADLVAARRINSRQRQADTVDDVLAAEVVKVARKAETELSKMPLGMAISTLQGLSSLKSSVFPNSHDRGEHGRSVAILIGFMPGDG